MFRRKGESAADKEQSELSLEVHRFSQEALAVAKSYVTGDRPAEDVKADAQELLERLPEVSGRAGEATLERHPDLNRTLSDARLDLTYVLSDGKRPSSTRLARFIEEQGAS